MIGDVVIAEPKALIGFAGPRVIEQTVRAEAARRLPARRVPAREGRDRHDRRPPRSCATSCTLLLSLLQGHAGRQPPRDAARGARARVSAQVAGDVEPAGEDPRASPTACARSTPDEVEIALPYLSGDIRQGKLALGYATLHSALAIPPPRRCSTLHGRRCGLRAAEEARRARARPSSARRSCVSLFAKATADEQDFLVRLIVGELRQGALEGVMLEAVAAAAQLPAAEVRRAAMFAGGHRAGRAARRSAAARRRSRSSRSG